MQVDRQRDGEPICDSTMSVRAWFSNIWGRGARPQMRWLLDAASRGHNSMRHASRLPSRLNLVPGHRQGGSSPCRFRIF